MAYNATEFPIFKPKISLHFECVFLLNNVPLVDFHYRNRHKFYKVA